MTNKETSTQQNLLKLSKNSKSLWHFSHELLSPSMWVWPRSRGSLTLQILIKAYISHQEGQATSISHSPQLQVEKAKFLVSVTERSGQPFSRPLSRDRGSTPGRAGPEDWAPNRRTTACSWGTVSKKREAEEARGTQN